MTLALTKEAPPTGLSASEREIIELFVQLAGVIGYPRSIGELYGLLFLSPDPLSSDELLLRLGLSKGSASQGLKMLRALGAIKTVYVPGDRRRYFQAELNLRRILSGFLTQQVAPALAEANQRIERIDDLLGREDGQNRDWLHLRLGDLRRWSRHSGQLAPLVASLFKPKKSSRITEE